MVSCWFLSLLACCLFLFAHRWLPGTTKLLNLLSLTLQPMLRLLLPLPVRLPTPCSSAISMILRRPELPNLFLRLAWRALPSSFSTPLRRASPPQSALRLLWVPQADAPLAA